MVYLSLDLSTTSSGYAVFEDTTLIDYGCFKPKGDDWRERISQIAPFIKDLIIDHKVDKVIVEDVPLMKKQMKTLVILGAVQGVLLGVTSSMNIPVEFILPSSWRSPLGLFDGTREGTHRNEMKRKSIEKANELFGIKLQYVSPCSKKNDDDISDAILIAYSKVGRKQLCKNKGR